MLIVTCEIPITHIMTEEKLVHPTATEQLFDTLISTLIYNVINNILIV